MSKYLRNKTVALPYSCQIIGAVVEALGIEDEILTNKTAKRYYSGRAVDKYSLERIYVTLGKKLEELNIFPPPQMFKKHDVSMANITAASLARLGKKWDSLRATIQSRSAEITDYSQAIKGFCRLLVVDLALRIVAWHRLANFSPPKPETPLWAEENGTGKALRALLSQSGKTRDEFTAWAEVSHTSIDNWFDGKVRPTMNHINDLTSAFSKLIPSSNEYVLQLQFEKQFTLAYLADILATNIGREAVIELAGALYRFVWLISEDINSMNRPPIEKVAGVEFETLRHGTDEPHIHALLHNLALVEKDSEWKKDIIACTTEWDLRFQEIVTQSSARISAGLAQELPEEAKRRDLEDGTEEDLGKLKEASSLGARDYARMISGDLTMVADQFRDGIDDRRLIVKRHPLSPQAHAILGSFLGMVGNHVRNREMMTEGINECRIAASLCKDWDMPLVEAAIILLNAGQYDEALVELETVARKLHAMTPHLAFNRGYALMQRERYEQALSDFEFVINSKPDYALALDHAAHCAFLTNNHSKGMKYAKDARKFGMPRTFNDWQRGVYRKRGKGSN